MASFVRKRVGRGSRWVYGSFRPKLEALEDRIVPAVFQVGAGDVAGLIAAINTANGNGQSNEIDLTASTYDLNAVDNYWYGPNGLPAITSNITLVGNGATIQRDSDSDTPAFRLFYVSGGMDGELPLGQLTLQDVTLQNGLAEGGNSRYGGGGMGAGGAIFNQGSLTLNRVTLTNNEALGGSGDDSDLSSMGGGGMGGNADDSGNGGGFGGELTGGPYGGQGGSGGSDPIGGGGGGFVTEADGQSDGTAGGLGGFGSLGINDGGRGGASSSNTSGAGGDFGAGGINSNGGGGGGVGGGGGFGQNGGGGGFGGGGGYGLGGNGGTGGFGGGGGTGTNGGSSGGFGGGSGYIGSNGGLQMGGGGAGFGGAIFNMGASTVPGSGTVVITNSTLTANTAQGGSGYGGGQGGGGALFNLDGNVTLNSSTLAANSALGGEGSNVTGFGAGGAVYNLAFGNVIQTGDATSANLTLNNSILSNSTISAQPVVGVVDNLPAGSGDLFAIVLNGNNTNSGSIAGSTNLVQTSSFFSTPVANGVITSTADPNLGSLQNNGGLTPTMALTPSSPAYGAGNANISGLPAVDQRGQSRLNTQGLDLGAFEYQTVTPFPPSPSPAPSPLSAPVEILFLAEDHFALTVDTVLFTVTQNPALIQVVDQLMIALNNLLGLNNPALGTGLDGLQSAINASPFFGTPWGYMAEAIGLEWISSLFGT